MRLDFLSPSFFFLSFSIALRWRLICVMRDSQHSRKLLARQGEEGQAGQDSENGQASKHLYVPILSCLSLLFSTDVRLPPSSQTASSGSSGGNFGTLPTLR